MNDEQQIIEPVPTMAGYKKIPTFKLWIANQFPYIETDFDAITNYELLQAVIKYLNTIIENENNVESNVTALYNAFVNLHDYVENYFDNLDVQEEINNKLDEMVKDGTFDNLLNNYLQLTKVYNTTVELLASNETFEIGEKLKTLGYYAINDGGGAEFYVSDSQSGISFQLSDGKYALMIIKNNTLNINSIGAKSNDNTFDNSSVLSNAISLIHTNNISNLFFDKGIYTFKTKIEINLFLQNKNIYSNSNETIFSVIIDNDYFIKFNLNVLRLKFKNIRIELNNTNKGIYFPYTSSFSYHIYFENTNFYGGLQALTFEHCGYVYLNNCTFTYLNDTLTEDISRIKIGSLTQESSYNEYFYITNCNIDGGNGKLSGNGITIHQIEYIEINNCDICNFYGLNAQNGYGLYVFSNGRCWDLYINDCSMPRNYVSVYLHAYLNNIVGIYINNLFTFQATTNWNALSNIIKTTRSNTYSVQYLTAKNVNALYNASYQKNVDFQIDNCNYADIENTSTYDLVLAQNSSNYVKYTNKRENLQKSRRKYFNNQGDLAINDSQTVVYNNSASALNLSNITGGKNGDIIIIYSNQGNLTIKNNTLIKLKARSDLLLNSHETCSLVFCDNAWYQF